MLITVWRTKSNAATAKHEAGAKIKLLILLLLAEVLTCLQEGFNNASLIIKNRNPLKSPARIDTQAIL